VVDCYGAVVRSLAVMMAGGAEIRAVCCTEMKNVERYPN
jgi:hypothetical protein